MTATLLGGFFIEGFMGRIKISRDDKPVTRSELAEHLDDIYRRIDQANDKHGHLQYTLDLITQRIDALAQSMRNFNSLKTWISGTGAALGAAIGSALFDYLTH